MSNTSSSGSITSLLNSLHSHLQSQTQLLPTLHAQLGLPDTALADELSTLQQSLTRCVEDQIDGRRKEVELWMEKCESVEEECGGYYLALGSYATAKGITGSVADARKEPILPRRHEMLMELQEKLRQRYHTKFEQLLTITSRLTALSRTLDPGFFSHDVLEPKIAGDEDTYNSCGHRDVTPERFALLEKELVRGKSEMAKRVAHLQETFVQIDWLYTELGIAPPAVEDDTAPPTNLLTLSSLYPRATSTASASSSTSDPFLLATPTPQSRTSSKSSTSSKAPLFSSVSSDPMEEEDHVHEQIFARFCVLLEQSDAAAPTPPLDIEPTPALISWSHSLLTSLSDLKRRREARIQAMYDQLEALWRRMGVDDADMDGFVEANRGSTEETERMYEEELERMLELKREKMSSFVGSARKEIEKLWDEMMVGEDERKEFAPFFDDQHTEELLVMHEEEIKRLKDEKRMKAHLLGSIRKYFDICEEEKELAAAASDQTRLLGRGPRDPGRLLREEKMRKRVQKEKPRLEQDLLASLPAWEAEAERPFLVHGERMLDILNALHPSGSNPCRGEKENKRRPATRSQSRAGSVPPRATTPSNSGHPGYAPTTSKGTSIGTVTPAVRPRSAMSSSRTAPAKKPRLGDSTSRSTEYGPSKIAGPSSMARSGPASSLPRPVALPASRSVSSQYPSTGHPRIPSASNNLSRSAFGRSASKTALGTYAGGAAGLSQSRVARKPDPAVVKRKAERARRESFRPRPSIDADLRIVVGKYSGGDEAVKEEEED